MNERRPPESTGPAKNWSKLSIVSFVQGAGAFSAIVIYVYTVFSLHRPSLPFGLTSGVLGLGAVVSGIGTLRHLRRHPELRGKGLAIGGIVLGGIPLCTFF